MLVDNYVDRGSARTALVIADNAVLNRQYMVGNRRGFDYFTQTAGTINQLFEYEDFIIQHQNGDGSLWYGDNASGTRTQYAGTYFAPSGRRISGSVSRGSLFLSTTAGVKKIDAYNHTPVQAGLTKALDVRLTQTGSSGFMNGFSKAAYRITWTRLDANKQLVRSDVSARVIATNNTRVNVTSATLAAGTVTITTATNHPFATSDTILIAGATQVPYDGSFVVTVTSPTTFTYTIVGAPVSPATGTITAERLANVSVAFTAPQDITSTDTYEVWRTATLDAGTSDPGDTEFLVVALTGATPGSTVTYVDTTADSSLLNATPLYTNATAGQGGAAGGNVHPPFCTTHCDYKDYHIYGNTALDHQFVLTFLSVTALVAGSSSITLTNAISGSRTYTAQVAENVATRSFQLFSASTPALNIEATARSLCHVINGDSGGFFYAEYTSGVTQAPGIIRIWARSPLTGSFTLKADSNTTGGQFSPTLPTAGTTIISDNDARPNRLYFSKFQQPDAVPLTNSIDIGRLDQPIQRVISIRDACFILKADGIWFLSGLTTPFSVTELDTNAHIIAPESAAAVDNQIYMLSNEGFLKVSVSGAEIISFSIEPLIQPLLTLSNLSQVAFGVGHLSEHLYICWLPSNSGDTYCKQAFVFHTFIKEWTRWLKPAQSGIALNTNYCLYLGSGLENALLKQRKNGDTSDYSDETQPITVTAQAGLVLTVTWTNTNFTPSVGLSIHQGAVVAKVTAVTFVSGTTWTFTIDRAVSFVAPSTWNAADANAGIALSNGNLTALDIVGTGADVAVRGTRAIDAGKVYFEVTYNVLNTGSGGDSSIGLANANESLSNFGGGAGGNSMAFYPNVSGASRIEYSNGGIGSAGPTAAPGDTIGVAIDRPNRRAWWRKNNGAFVVNGVTVDITVPTPTAWFDISGLGAGSIFPFISLEHSDQLTANFGASAFVGTLPSGFQPANQLTTTARLPIQSHIRFAPDVCNDSGIDKTFYSATVILEHDTVTQASIELGTNEAPFLATFPIVRTVTGGWGSAWGSSWGDLDSPVRTIPFSVDCPVPDITGETITIGFIHNVSQEPFQLAQTSVFWDANAEYEVVR